MYVCERVGFASCGLQCGNGFFFCGNGRMNERNVCINERMKEWKNERTNGWMNTLIDKWKKRLMEEWMK